MAVEIAIGVLTDLHEKFLVIHSADEFNSLVRSEMQLFLKLIKEFFIHIRDNSEVFFALTFHVLRYHGFVIIFRDEAPNYEIILMRTQPLSFVPVSQAFTVI